MRDIDKGFLPEITPPDRTVLEMQNNLLNPSFVERFGPNFSIESLSSRAEEMFKEILQLADTRTIAKRENQFQNVDRYQDIFVKSDGTIWKELSRGRLEVPPLQIGDHGNIPYSTLLRLGSIVAINGNREVYASSEEYKKLKQLIEDDKDHKDFPEFTVSDGIIVRTFPGGGGLLPVLIKYTSIKREDVYSYFRRIFPYIRVKYKNKASQNKFVWKLEYEPVFGNYAEAEVQVTDPSSPVTHEEFLHAAEELVRDTVQQLDQIDGHLYEGTKNVVHSSIVWDWALTAAAVELGEFDYWHERARRQTEIDKSYIDSITTTEDPVSSLTLLGKSVNERFQYPQISEKYLDIVVANLGLDIGRTWFYPNGSVNPHMYNMTELVMLSYGEDHLDITLRLMECGDVVQGKIVNAGRAAIDLAKLVLFQYKGTDQEANLVRHHKPLSRKLTNDDFQYKVSSSKLWQITQSTKKGLPVVFTLQDLKRQGILNRFKRSVPSNYFK